MKYKLLILGFLCLTACKETKPKQLTKTDSEYLHAAQKKLTDLIITDIFTPPVASRVYVYPLLAAYEAGRFSKPDAVSITAQLRGFDAMPTPEAGKEYDYTIAAIKALCATAPKVIFSVKDMASFENQVLEELKTRTSKEVFNRSIAFGLAVSDIIIKRLSTDNYKETRGMERFEVTNDIIGRWVPTPPDYADGVEPHWGKIKTMALDSSAQCRPIPPPQYSEAKSSAFWKELEEVLAISKNFTEEQENILTFWDDNPFVSRHKGHLMFQDKKMTPGGHWLAIAQLFLKDKKADFHTSLKTYALTSLALYEAFISCWEAKYHYATVRPETVISAKLDKQWHPLLVTPTFPSYTSGHSTISAAAAEVLTGLFSDSQSFTDTTEKEASISRVYAGIHFRSDCDRGNEQGIKVGQLVLNKIKF